MSCESLSPILTVSVSLLLLTGLIRRLQLLIKSSQSRLASGFPAQKHQQQHTSRTKVGKRRILISLLTVQAMFRQGYGKRPREKKSHDSQGAANWLPSSVPDCSGNATPTDCDVIRENVGMREMKLGFLGENEKQHRFSVRFGKAASNKTI